MFKSFYKKIIFNGFDNQLSDTEIKKIKILNFSSLLITITVLSFFLLDYIQGILNMQMSVIFVTQLLFLILIGFFQKNKKFTTARITFLVLITTILTIQNNITFRGYYGEYLYLTIPLVSMFFFEKKILHYILLCFSLVLFYVPNMYVTIYPAQYFGYSNTLFLFSGVFGIVYFFKKQNIENETKLHNINKELEIIHQELQKSKRYELAQTELKALRSQMNPHFIFNSLNSIQDLVLQEDVDKSYDYIVLFADLVRSTLTHSDQDFITIDKELDFLEVYLELEKLRFGDEFSYQINYSGSEDLKIPSLVIQPFIENALLHGLLHKKGEKRLNITFELTDKLTCIVEDNGVGRLKSREIKERQKSQHASFSTQAIKKRMEILSSQFDMEASFIYLDLFENKKVLGTKVVIVLPFKMF